MTSSGREEQEWVYEAQQVAGPGRTFVNIGEARAYLDDLIGSDWFIDRWPTVAKVTVERRNLKRWGGVAFADHIVLSNMTERTLLHELAHLVTPGDGHGQLFRMAFVRLVRHRMGFYAGADLRNAFQGRLVAV